MFTNQPIKVIHFQKLAEKSILNGEFFSWEQEKLRSFDKARKLKKYRGVARI